MNIAKELARPFPVSCIKWRIGSVIKDKNKCNLLPYIDARNVQSRLDAVVGLGNWQVKFRHDTVYVKGETKTAYVCSLSIKLDGEWITKEGTADDTSYEEIKGGESDALKRAAVQFGIGRYLYSVSAQWVDGIPARWDVEKLVKQQGIDKMLLGPSSPEEKWFVGNVSEMITASQIGEIEGLIEETGTELERLLKHYRVIELAEMNQTQYKDCICELNKKLKGHDDG